jgi:hypothetical protein
MLAHCSPKVVTKHIREALLDYCDVRKESRSLTSQMMLLNSPCFLTGSLASTWKFGT